MHNPSELTNRNKIDRNRKSVSILRVITIDLYRKFSFSFLFLIMSVLRLDGLLVPLAGSVLCCGGEFESVQLFATEAAGCQTLCAHSMGKGARRVCMALAMVLMWARVSGIRGDKRGSTVDKHDFRSRIRVIKLEARVSCSNYASFCLI